MADSLVNSTSRASEQSIAAVRLAVDLLVREMVDEPDLVTITPMTDALAGVVLAVKVAPRDVGKVIGRGGRTARALRALLQAVAQSRRNSYRLDIEGEHDLAIEEHEGRTGDGQDERLR